jgi:hypothetical protein
MPLRRLTLAIAALALLCGAAAAVGAVLRPRSFGSHQETIAYALEQRGVRPAAVEIGQHWPEAVNYYAYGHQIYPFNANVIVRLEDGREALGRMECLDDRRRCTLYIPRLGVESAKLPDVSARRAWPWEEWLGAVREQLQF